MAAFDLGATVTPITYDFTTGASGWDPKDGPGKGLIPDPNRKQIVAFQHAISDALGLPAGARQEEVTAAMTALDPEESEKLADAMLDALTALCSGSPSGKELAALSVRGLNAFSGFIHGELSQTNPT